jgi:protein ImuB
VAHEVLPFDPALDAATLRSLAVWAGRFSPAVALDPPAGLFLDVAGCERLFRGEERHVERVLEGVARLGFTARAAVASTPGCAWAVARHGPVSPARVPPGGEREALAALPVEALRIPAETVEALGEVGVREIGALYGLPREALSSRFPEGLLSRLDQALGLAEEPLEPVRERPPPSRERAFSGPVSDALAVRAACRALLLDLADDLDAAGRGALRIDVRATRSDAPPLLERVDLARPSARGRHLVAVTAPRIERWDLGFGVESVRVVAARTRRLRREQEAAWPDVLVADADAGLDRATGEALDALVARCGERRVVGFEPAASHVPERAFRPRSPAAPPSGAEVVAHDRPSVLWEFPEEAEAVALLPDGPPARLSWRGEVHAVVRAVGPERIATPWWDGPPDERDYFRLLDDAGRWLWIYRDLRTNRWFVHGEWA